LKCLIKNQKGFTMAEVVIAMVIMLVIISAFMSLFTTGIIGIHSAGDTSLAYSDAQSDVESRLGTKTVDEENSTPEVLIIEFEGLPPLEIPGELISSFAEEGSRTSTLETFMPTAPTIFPVALVEGQNIDTNSSDVHLITIEGINTNFDDTQTTALITTIAGETISTYTSAEVTVDSATSASVFLKSHLLNAQGEYILAVTTGTEIARAKVTVEKPRYLVAGGGSVYASADSSYWFDRKTNSYNSDLSAFTGANDSCYGNGSYLLVGDNGNLFISKDRQAWNIFVIFVDGVSQDLYGVTWSAFYNKFFVSGDEGAIYSSFDGETWTKLNSNTTDKLYDIASTLDGKIIAVGQNGTVATSVNGSDFTSSLVGLKDLNAITVAGSIGTSLVLTVGNDGAIFTWDTLAGEWTDRSLNSEAGNPDLYGVTYREGSEMLFVAVGADGALYTSPDGAAWSSRDSNTTVDLNDVTHGYGNRFVAVGESVILISENSIDWDALTGGNAPAGSLSTISAR
jgi:prepilin-type N-terminal cleavage/methylation domain-containing protein